MEIQYWFEFASTYSYPATMRIERLAAEANVDIAWRPFLLGPIFKRQGLTTSPFNTQVAKGNYMWRDMERVCAEMNLPFNKPSVFPRNGLLAARVAFAAGQSPWLGDFARAVYTANFVHDQDIASPSVIADILSRIGQNADAIMASAEHMDCKTGLLAQTSQAEALGVFGSPSYRVNGELFWGNDRLSEALAWAKARRGERRVP